MRASQHTSERIPFAVKWKIHGSIMTSEQTSVNAVVPVARPKRLNNQHGEGNSRSSNGRGFSWRIKREQIALVANIENTRCYLDVGGKWKVGPETLRARRRFAGDNLYCRRMRLLTPFASPFESYRGGKIIFTQLQITSMMALIDLFRAAGLFIWL